MPLPSTKAKEPFVRLKKLKKNFFLISLASHPLSALVVHC